MHKFGIEPRGRQKSRYCREVEIYQTDTVPSRKGHLCRMGRCYRDYSDTVPRKKFYSECITIVNPVIMMAQLNKWCKLKSYIIYT